MKYSCQYRLLITIVLLNVFGGSYAANRYSVASGNWSSASTWSANSDGAPGASVPVAGDAVYIQRNFTVTVNIPNAACASIIIGVKNNNAGILQFNSGSVLTVSGNIILGEDKGSGNPTGSLIMTNGGLLQVEGAFTSPNPGTWTPGTGTIEYNGAAAQTILPNVYNNLTLSGSGIKTTTAVTVNGILSMEATATVSAAPTYGTSATLQYNTATSRSAGAEWLATFAATGGVKIINTGTITLIEAKVFNTSVPLNIATGTSLATANFQLTFGGNFITGSGSLNAGSSLVIINGNAAQNIAGFTTTGLVSMTKTGGTATFQGAVNGADLTINGAGGTLNLGADFTHTFSGTWTRTNGTLNGGSSTLRLGSSYSGTGGTFTAGTGAVEYYSAGAQSVAPLTYNNLTLTGSGAKTFPAGTTTVNGILSMEGTATTVITGALNYGASSTLQYKGSAVQTTGNEFPITFSGSGGVIINNVNGVILGASRTITGGLKLTSGTFSINSNTLTLQTSNIPISRTSGTISTTSSSNLSFGSLGFTAGNAFAIPAGNFTDNPASLNTLSVYRTNQLTLGDQMINIWGSVLCNGPLATNNNLTLLSTASGTAYVINGPNVTDQITGNVTMQRYLATGGYKYFSSPFSNVTVGQFSQEVHLNKPFPRFYSYDESDLTSSGWVNYTAVSGNLEQMHGYAINFGPLDTSLIVNVTGSVTNIPVSRTLNNSGGDFTQGFNLVGNPYPSPIDWNSASGWTKTNIEACLYYFKAELDGIYDDQYSGNYYYYVSDAAQTGDADNIIPSMQAFFVHVDNGTTGTLSMTNTVRTGDANPTFIKGEAEIKPLIELTASYAKISGQEDPLIIYFDEKGTNNFDGQLDAYKLMNTSKAKPNFYSVADDGKILAINALPVSGDSMRTIPLGLKIEQPGQVFFRLKRQVGLPEGIHILLHDAVTSTDRLIDSVKGYTVSLSAGEYRNRFSISFYYNEKSQPENWPGQDFLNAYFSNGKLSADIGILTANRGKLSIRNIIGQTFFSKDITSIGYQEFEASFKPGIYILTYITGKIRVSKKIFISDNQ